MCCELIHFSPIRLTQTVRNFAAEGRNREVQLVVEEIINLELLPTSLFDLVFKFPMNKPTRLLADQLRMGFREGWRIVQSKLSAYADGSENLDDATDVYSRVIGTHLTGKASATRAITASDMARQAGLFLVAGQDTTVGAAIRFALPAHFPQQSALMWFLIELSRNPTFQHDLRKEIFGRGATSYDELPLLNAAIKVTAVPKPQ